VKRSCFILGSGRSGTSLTAGLLAEAGYFMGDRLFAGDEGNPKGYFEDREINGINEGLLAQLLPGPRRTLADKLLGRERPRAVWYRWLAEIPADRTMPSSLKLAKRIQRVTAREPFCFKDPRFCYTLGVWRRLAPEAAMLCVLRHPETSAESIVKEAQRNEILLDGAPVDYERALRIWRMMYDYVLDVHYPAGGDWLFVHYEQLISGTAYEAIEKLLRVNVQREFADTKLRRSKTPPKARADVAELYQRLCDLAGYRSS
jgi:hypothetical protein